jgi:DNA-binding MarR family transcriptional regulator
MPATPTSNVDKVDRPTENPLHHLVRTFGLLERVMQPYFAQFGISGSQWGVLRVLHRAEGEGLPGLRLTDLSKRLLIRPPSVTGVVDRLERLDLVVRQGQADDLRVKMVSLTDKGRELLHKVLAVHGQQIATVFGGLSTPEQGELLRLLRRLEQHLEGLLDQTPLNGN